ncbi:hypothetical protein LOK49_LG06G00586 [Camellia lanceoleosa]|uniref:Uncharacterized protein n=1 Tax=Camellia lanceoleosa TaxID=1840588 RepID=A0ACC0HED4_9ERIC|nr:hypothetical protein LOK49_LG06G00586 [Camellia lanceoleosa]
MGGGGVMRAAAKVAGIGVVNAGLRGSVTAEHPVSAAARKASRPVSAIVSSSDDVKSNVIDAAVQRPCWELDEWEFAGGVEDQMTGEPMPRLVFGGAPTLQEAKEATSDLKDALEKVYLSSPNSTGCSDSRMVGHESALSLLSKPEYQETKACVVSETTAPSVPKNALKAFRLLNENPATQTVVASIACDPNVWNAVLQNEALVEFLQTNESTTLFSDMDPVMKESVATAEFLDPQPPKNVDDSSDSKQSADSGNGFMGFMENIKTTVVEMMNSLSDYFQNIFGGPSAEKVAADADGSAKATIVNGVVGSSIMGLTVMVIMMVVLKRG